MNVNIDRIKGFSDGFIAIIITLMILEIPIPDRIIKTELLVFLKALFIYGASFIIIARQWKRHYYLIDDIKSISNIGICENMIWLFSLSLIPIFMKWVIEFPFSIIPALGYFIVYLLNDLSISILFLQLLKENPEHQINHNIENQEYFSLKHIIILVCIIFAILAISFNYLQFSIICFIVFPTVMSSKKLLVNRKNNTHLKKGIFRSSHK